MKYPEILSIVPDPVIFDYKKNDTMLYGLAVGMGADPMDTRELRFVYEKELRAIPTMSALLNLSAGPIVANGGIDMARLVHGEQRLRIHNTLPAVGSIRSTARCLSVVDKGLDHGAIVNIECTVADALSGLPYSTSTMSLFCRGDGGCGGDDRGGLLRQPIPEGPADAELVIATRPDQALLYRLTGDINPLHCDPDTAARAGFERPILHGLCTYGIICRAMLKTYCDYDPSLIKGLDVSFSAPVYPGETLVIRVWKIESSDDQSSNVISRVAFEVDVRERQVTVVKHGLCLLSAEIASPQPGNQLC